MSVVHLTLDFETRSCVNLKEHGLDRYAKDPSTEVLMLGWAINDSPVYLWEPRLGPMPEQLEMLLTRPEAVKIAWEVGFERIIFKEVLGIDIPIEQWIDAKVMARYASMVGGLEAVGKIMGLDEDKAKMKVGKKLIERFSIPRKKKKKDSPELAARTFYDWQTHPEDWQMFCDYCRRDVEAERDIFKRLKPFYLPPIEQRAWRLDSKINERGIPVDMTYVNGADWIVSKERNERTEEMTKLTGLANPNSNQQFLAWIKEQGYPFGSLGKKWVTKALEESPISEAGRQGLKLRQILAKSSTSKLTTFQNYTGLDGRARHTYVYYGAARTGRWSGKNIQPHNFVRGELKPKDYEVAVEMIRQMDSEGLKRFGNPLDIVSTTLRGAFRAPEGKKFVICDLSAIENVVIGWVSGCKAILDVFREGRDPYLDFGVHLYSTPYEVLEAEYKAGNKTRRTNAKPPVLGAGFGLSGGEEDVDKNGDDIKTGLWGYAENMGIELTREDSHKAVAVFRNRYTEVPRLWDKLETGVVTALQTGETQQVGPVLIGAVKPCKMFYIILPSGRRLHYIRPKLERETRWKKETYKISYENNVPPGGKWGRTRTWGGKLTENVVQAIARDLLLNGMFLAEEKGFEIVMHTHDEIVGLTDERGALGVDDLHECMTTRPEWGLDIPINAAGFESKVYRKD